MAEKAVADEDDERRQIVHRYEQGREKILEDIAEWEDPTNEAYHVTDRYGFIHDYKLPEKLSKFESQMRELESSRRDKWIKMLNNWEHYVKTEPKKLRRRVYKGIPNAVRGKAWCCLLGVEELKRQQEGKYNELWTFGKQHSPDVRQIDLDINRTFRNNQMFRERYNPKQQELFRVLVAYSVYNCEIGYCQGMSQIAALLLMFTSEEEAFWCMDRLMSKETYAMHGFFIPGFPKLNRFARHHDLVLKRFLPKVCKHLKKFDIDSTLYTLKWFFQCFLDRVPFSLTLRLWDCFMLDGEMILTCMSYTLLKLHKKTILRKSMEDLIHFLQIELEKDFGYHDDEAIEALELSILELKKKNMNLPQEAASDMEKPSKPFGILLQTYDTLSLINDDRSVVGSIVLRTNNLDDNVSLAATSRTASEADLDDFEELNETEIDEMTKRKLSVYDNVDLNESIEAAKRISVIEESKSPTTFNSGPTPEPEGENHFARNSQLNGSIKSVELRKGVDNQANESSNEKSTIDSVSAEVSAESTNKRLSVEKKEIPVDHHTGDDDDKGGKKEEEEEEEEDQTTFLDDKSHLKLEEQKIKSINEQNDKENQIGNQHVDQTPNGHIDGGVVMSDEIKTKHRLESHISTDEDVRQSNVSPENRFKRKTSIPKLKNSTRSSVRSVADSKNDQKSFDLSAKNSQIRTPQRLPPFSPLSPVPTTSGNSVIMTSVTTINSGMTTMTTVSSSSSPPPRSVSAVAPVAQIGSYSSLPRSGGIDSPINSPTSPTGGKGSLIPRLQVRSPISNVLIKSPNQSINNEKKIKPEVRSPPTISPTPPHSQTTLPSHVTSSHIVDSNSLERRLNQIKSNINSDGVIESMQPQTGKSLEQNSFPESAKVRIYVPYMKHSANSSNHGSSGNLSGVSSTSLHNSVITTTTAVVNRHGNGNAVSGEELNRIQINVASELKTKSYLPRIDT